MAPFPRSVDEPARKRYFRLNRRDLAYLTFILESYEGLGTLTTVEKKQETLVSLTAAPGLAGYLADLMRALQKEIRLTDAPPPPDQTLKENSHA